jgi:hypothetical protein
MPTPRERLQKLIDARLVSEIVFKPMLGKENKQTVILLGHITKQGKVQESTDDKALFDALSDRLTERWDPETGVFMMDNTPEQLWEGVKSRIASEYEYISKRCAATKRKTVLFIYSVKLDDKFLPNFLIQTYLKVHSPSYQALLRTERETFFEQFESLRRTYGKRS